MASTTTVTRSLEQVASEYAVFEKDQVLTHDQLNTLSEFAGDQERLTRVRLLGVGVLCGLRPSLSGSTVTVTKGVGVTTDGDLLYLDQDTSFSAYRDYDATFPPYPPLYQDGKVPGTMFAAYELLEKASSAATDHPLAEFGTRTGGGLNTMVVALLMESFDHSDDICTGTDCDNKGGVRRNTQRVLLVEGKGAAALHESAASPGDVFDALPQIAARRPALPHALDGAKALSQVYAPACDAILGQLGPALEAVAKYCGTLLPDVASPGAIQAAIGDLKKQREQAAEVVQATQYFYDYLKDLVDAYGEFRERLFGDTTWCVPALDAFPKHLLLGDLAAGASAAAGRTRFYPSPLTGRSAGALDEARFLLGRLTALIHEFHPDVSAGLTIRITPSAGEDRPLGERAIPFYYRPNGTYPTQKRWSYRRTQRGEEGSTYSYNAAAWGATGAAADPLSFQIARFPVFRVEGHVGTPVATVLAAIEKEIGDHDLPFVARSLLLGAEPTKLVKKPGILYTDLHRLHYVLRQDAVRQLDEAKDFSGTFKQQVTSAISSGSVKDLETENEGVKLQEVATQKDATVTARASAARGKLNRDYSAYAADPSWSDDVKATVTAAGEFKHNLSPVVKTEFNTPFDTLIGSTHLDWLPWLDQLLKLKEQEHDTRLLFGAFVDEHPQIEHVAGVPRGGTFVLLYDESGTVVGDVALPYYCPEPPRVTPAEPPLLHPGFRDDFVLHNPLRILPSRTSFVGAKLGELQATIDTRIDTQTKNFDALRLSYVSALTDTMQVVKGTTSGETVVNPAYKDNVLGALVNEQKATEERVDAMRQRKPADDAPAEEKDRYNKEMVTAENDLANATQRTAKYVAGSGMDVSFGSEGYSALAQVSTGVSKLSNTTTKTATRTAITQMEGASDTFRQAATFMIR